MIIAKGDASDRDLRLVSRVDETQEVDDESCTIAHHQVHEQDPHQTCTQTGEGSAGAAILVGNMHARGGTHPGKGTLCSSWSTSPQALCRALGALSGGENRAQLS